MNTAGMNHLDKSIEQNESPNGDDKDLPLRDDIRFLGRMLGDTLREQEGDEAFELVENKRAKN